MKKPSKNVFFLILSQVAIGALLLHGAVRRIERSYKAEALRQELRDTQTRAARLEQKYYALTSPGRVAEIARERGFIPAPLSAFKEYVPQNAEDRA